MASTPWTSAQKRQKRREYDRHFKAINPASTVRSVNVVVPEDVERREVSSSCFMCESRGPCRHRKWMLADG